MGYLICDAAGAPASAEVVRAVELGLDNCDFVYDYDMRALLNAIGLKIVYDPRHQLRPFERGSFDWTTRHIYLDDNGLQVSLVHEVGHLLDSEAGCPCMSRSRFTSPWERSCSSHIGSGIKPTASGVLLWNASFESLKRSNAIRTFSNRCSGRPRFMN